MIAYLVGLYNKLKYPEPERPRSRASTIDSRRSDRSKRSDGSTASRRSRRRSRRYEETEADRNLERRRKRHSRRMDDDEEELYAEIMSNNGEPNNPDKRQSDVSVRKPEDIYIERYFLEESPGLSSSTPLYLNKTELCRKFDTLPSNSSLMVTPTQKRQKVSMATFRSLPRHHERPRTGSMFASEESLSDKVKHNEKKIRFLDERR